MSIEKIGLTLYDFLGYLLPGYVLILSCSLVESTFLGSDLLSLSRVSGNYLPFTIAAYFLGHVSHGIGSVLKDRLYKWFTDRKGRLSSPLFERVRESARNTYEISQDPGSSLAPLETYLLADSYIVASGGSPERDILTVREGFHKASMVAFGFLLVVLLSCLGLGGAKIQTQPGTFTRLSPLLTGVLALVTTIMTLVFRRGFMFFNRLKINKILTVFLALRQKALTEKRG